VGKYYVKIERTRVIEAETPDEAQEKFWADWEQDCAEGNSTMLNELGDSTEVRKATTKEVEAER